MKVNTNASDWNKLGRLKKAAKRIAEQIKSQEKLLGFDELKEIVTATIPVSGSDILYTATGIAVAKASRVAVAPFVVAARVDSRITVL
jgi:hypothetical protein